MKAKSRISPQDTYTFDQEDVDHLDGLSITSILDEAADALDDTATTPALASEPAEDRALAIDNEPTIDELLADPVVTSAEIEDISLADTGTFEALDVLLAPELMFGRLDED